MNRISAIQPQYLVVRKLGMSSQDLNNDLLKFVLALLLDGLAALYRGTSGISSSVILFVVPAHELSTPGTH